MNNVTYKLKDETEMNVKVKAVISEQGVDIKVDSDVDTPVTATALFLALMATYEMTEEEATKIFETMADMVEEFKNKGGHKHEGYIN